MAVFDPREMNIVLDTEYDVRVWRRTLRQHLFRTRLAKCENADCDTLLHETGFDVHEGIVSRQDVRGWSLPKSAWIFCEYNCVMLCPDCNRNGPQPSRQFVWDLQCARYGEAAVRSWYEALPFRTGKPPRLFGS